ncbi:hypothetical protein Snoj_29250 [Streptomyces nojiriensis]|uniref:Uncharacterized protein n=1 Tax=Streptomyces nojiriensis TaxID=66374 RepID=A0ABQ3SLU2_9ACTN|nr:hypothetical protein [Streptomyces nojiriensis]GGS35791.1 hypothetical protein GCM10010205_77370 [Streptomyces nojiriensis]GHI69007.1 hypothetical protein Snoj_29250 [Streptomyces nojiriensis]
MFSFKRALVDLISEASHCSLCSGELPHDDGYLTLGTCDLERSPDEG